MPRAVSPSQYCGKTCARFWIRPRRLWPWHDVWAGLRQFVGGHNVKAQAGLIAGLIVLCGLLPVQAQPGLPSGVVPPRGAPVTAAPAVTLDSRGQLPPAAF